MSELTDEQLRTRFVGRVQSWRTFKKNFRPPMMRLVDSIGSSMTVDPTLKALGFHTTQVDLANSDHCYYPIAEAEAPESAKCIVYHVWKSRDGWSKFMDVYWK